MLAGVTYQLIAIEDLRLDGQNPRHPTEVGQRETISALLRDETDKLVRLAGDIAENGVNPMDTILVLKDADNSFTVLEGNRRVASLKLLSNPRLAGNATLEKTFREIAKQAKNLPNALPCRVVASRNEAKHWLELRHTGENAGVGIVPWSAEAQARFSGRMGSQAGRALLLVEALEGAYPDNRKLQTDLATVRQNRLTTLGRLISDPRVRGKLGLDFEGGQLMTHVPVSNVESALARIVSDLADRLTVSALKTKEQRQKYIAGVRGLPDPKSHSIEAVPFTRLASPHPRARRRRPRPSIPSKRLLTDVQLTNLSPRIAALVRELQQLDIDLFPNTAAVLLRVVLDLAVDDFHDKKNLRRGQEFKDRVRRALHIVDPTDKEPRFQAVRTGLQDATSLYAVSTLHGFVHNQHFHPSPTELRSIAAKYSDFLIAVDAAAVP
jgi:hypothetical protein